MDEMVDVLVWCLGVSAFLGLVGIALRYWVF